MKQFKVGDKVRIVRSPFPERVGTITTIVGGPMPMVLDVGANSWHASYGVREGEPTWALDMKTIDGCGYVGYPTSHLEPFWDGKEPCSWEECLWRPKRVEENA